MFSVLILDMWEELFEHAGRVRVQRTGRKVVVQIFFVAIEIHIVPSLLHDPIASWSRVMCSIIFNMDKLHLHIR